MDLAAINMGDDCSRGLCRGAVEKWLKTNCHQQNLPTAFLCVLRDLDKEDVQAVSLNHWAGAAFMYRAAHSWEAQLFNSSL